MAVKLCGVNKVVTELRRIWPPSGTGDDAPGVLVKIIICIYYFEVCFFFIFRLSIKILGKYYH